MYMCIPSLLIAYLSISADLHSIASFPGCRPASYIYIYHIVIRSRFCFGSQRGAAACSTSSIVCLADKGRQCLPRTLFRNDTLRGRQALGARRWLRPLVLFWSVGQWSAMVAARAPTISSGTVSPQHLTTCCGRRPSSSPRLS